MTRSKSKARDTGKSGSDGSVEGHWEVKLRGMDPKAEMLITKGGGQMNVNARKKEISHVDLKMELMPSSEVNMMINPTFGGTEAGMEVEEILATMNDSDEMEEMFDVDAAMPGQARSTVNFPDRMGVEQDRMIGVEDPMMEVLDRPDFSQDLMSGPECLMEVSSTLIYMNNGDGDGRNVVMNMGVPDIKIGRNGPETGSCDDGILRNSTHSECGNAGMRLVNRFQLGPIEEFLGDHDREDISGGDASPFF
ncbi:hypothetical protein MA16_Dca027370 [Dendrobium catenatum]|uniref:Uncharacterized protein n=1 Tax=Dendrobium catenatum TaxID=906689 RepID=A0A2I0X066_9ASPA|nr:hypothetical protein MA16_Dca027370 [Dendrobium catenatum]